MGLFLFRFWPVIVPLLLYMLWMRRVRHLARKAGEEPPHFRDGPLYWLAASMLAVAALCFFALGVAMEERTGTYVPPRVEDGKMIPGHIEEKP